MQHSRSLSLGQKWVGWADTGEGPCAHPEAEVRSSPCPSDPVLEGWGVAAVSSRASGKGAGEPSSAWLPLRPLGAADTRYGGSTDMCCGPGVVAGGKQGREGGEGKRVSSPPRALLVPDDGGCDVA